MRLTYLQVQGFRCFAGSQTIYFPATGILPIVGRRKDGGSSGAGKSSVMQAIAYALKFSSFSAEKQQCWIEDSPSLQIDLGLETEDGQEKLVVRRGKKTEALLNGIREASGATDVNKWLLTYFGMEPDLLQALTFRPQRKGGLFLGLAPSKKRVFLASILGFKRFEDLADALGKESAVLDKQLAIQEALLARVSIPPEPEAPIKRYDWKDDFVDAFIDVDEVDADSVVQQVYEKARLAQERAIEEVDVELKAGKQWIEQQIVRRDQEIAVIKTAATKEANAILQETRDLPHGEAIGIAMERIKKLEDKRALLTGKIDGRQQETSGIQQRSWAAQSRRAATEGKIRDAQKTIDALNAKLCFTCGQQWQSQTALDAAKNDVENLVSSLETDAKILENLESELAAAKQGKAELQVDIVKCEDGIRGLRERLETMKAERTAAQLAFHQEREARRTAVRDGETIVLAGLHKRCEQDIYGARVANDANSAKLESLRHRLYNIEAKVSYCRQNLESVRRHNAVIEKLWEARRKAQQDSVELADLVVKLRAELDEKQDLQAAARAFLGAISEEVLVEIRDEANAMLATLPNVQGVGIRFVTETPTEAGQLRQEVKTVMTYGSEDDIDPESQLSGGQLTSVELAVDRAFSKVMRRRRGGQRLPSWAAFDEPFDGLDFITKSACLDFLRSDIDSQIFIIDHSSEFTEAFEHVVSVVVTEKGSTISIS